MHRWVPLVILNIDVSPVIEQPLNEVYILVGRVKDQCCVPVLVLNIDVLRGVCRPLHLHHWVFVLLRTFKQHSVFQLEWLFIHPHSRRVEWRNPGFSFLMMALFLAEIHVLHEARLERSVERLWFPFVLPSEHLLHRCNSVFRGDVRLLVHWLV